MSGENKLKSKWTKSVESNPIEHQPDELVTISKKEITAKVDKAAKKIAESNATIIPHVGVNLKMPHEIDVLLVNTKMQRRGQGIKISKEELILEAIREYYK